jgi:MOSC domain-containing protein YiiM
MAEPPRLVSIQVGRPRTHGDPDATDPLERAWTSAYVKDPVQGPRRLSRTQLEGDEQYDLDSHGGPQMAVLAYSAEHYPRWRAELGLDAMGPGGFGENFTIAGLDEDRVSIGDTFEIGTARVQVSQPRGPCANISRRWKSKELLQRATETARIGWYLRVLEEGTVEAGQEVALVDRPHPELTVARAFRVRREK